MRSLCLPLLFAVLLAAGCGGGNGAAAGPEQADTDYARGLDLQRRGLPVEALAAYLKVIGRRGDAASESHLQAGILYFQELKEPFKGWYHLQKYLELQPASPIRESVRQQVMAAEREVVSRSLAQSQYGGGELTQLREQNEQLAQKVARLEAEMRLVREPAGGVITRMEIPLNLQGPSAPSPAERLISLTNPAPAPANPIGLAPANPISLAVPSAVPAAAKAQTAAVPPPKGPSAPATTARTHTVRRGDTLSSLARQYYDGDQSAARLNALRQANRDVLRNGDSLSVDMVLRIP